MRTLDFAPLYHYAHYIPCLVTRCQRLGSNKSSMHESGMGLDFE